MRIKATVYKDMASSTLTFDSPRIRTLNGIGQDMNEVEATIHIVANGNPEIDGRVVTADDLWDLDLISMSEIQLAMAPFFLKNKAK
jgi:hypothetical protein